MHASGENRPVSTTAAVPGFSASRTVIAAPAWLGLPRGAVRLTLAADNRARFPAEAIDSPSLSVARPRLTGRAKRRALATSELPTDGARAVLAPTSAAHNRTAPVCCRLRIFSGWDRTEQPVRTTALAGTTELARVLGALGRMRIGWCVQGSWSPTGTSRLPCLPTPDQPAAESAGIPGSGFSSENSVIFRRVIEGGNASARRLPVHVPPRRERWDG